MKASNLTLIFLLVITVFSQTIRCAEPAIPPVVTISFDDGTISQYTYAFPIMNEYNVKGTFYAIASKVGTSGYMSPAQLLLLQMNGNEIGSHSYSHAYFPSLTEQQIRDECRLSKTALSNYGLNVKNFAYPYGEHTTFSDSIVDDYFFSGREAYVYPAQMPYPPVNRWLLQGYAGEVSTQEDTELLRLKSRVDRLQPGEWLIIFFHDVLPDDAGSNYAVSTSDFSAFLSYLRMKGVVTQTVMEALSDFSPVGDWSKTFVWTV